MYWGRILDIVSRLKTKKTKYRLFPPAGRLTVQASYVSSEILSKFTRVSLLISLISFELPPGLLCLVDLRLHQGANDLEDIFITIRWNKEFLIP